jgi:hypothetical protein
MKRFIVFVVFALALTGLCFAQSANDAQRIVGTWTVDDFSLTLNANGTYSSNQWGNGSYFISNSKLILNKTDEPQLTSLLSYYLSADGKVLVLADNADSGSGIWLIKK